MANYVFIESRDPFESRDTDFVTEAAGGLRRLGNDVVVFLIQNGVLAARKDAHSNYLSQLAEADVTKQFAGKIVSEQANTRGIRSPDAGVIFHMSPF